MGSCPDTDTDPLSPLQSIEPPLIHNGNMDEEGSIMIMMKFSHTVLSLPMSPSPS